LKTRKNNRWLELDIYKSSEFLKNFPRMSNKPKVVKMYTPAQVAEMDDDELAYKFTYFTGLTSLSCKHCKGLRPIRDNWILSIRDRCMYEEFAGVIGGLHKDMKLPKCCDKQQAGNKKRNKINNPIYRQLHLGVMDQTELVMKRLEMMKEIGVITNPKYYKA